MRQRVILTGAPPLLLLCSHTHTHTELQLAALLGKTLLEKNAELEQKLRKLQDFAEESATEKEVHACHTHTSIMAGLSISFYLLLERWWHTPTIHEPCRKCLFSITVYLTHDHCVGVSHILHINPAIVVHLPILTS